MKFIYKASDKTGQLTEGVIEASAQSEVVQMLRAKSLYLLDISELTEKTSKDISLGTARISKRALSIFCSQFASILKAGVPLVQTLAMLEEQTDDKRLKDILTSVRDELRRGTSLAKCFAMHEKSLPDIMIQMIDAGEVSGTLDRSLDRLSQMFDKDYQISRKVKSATTYPIVVGIVSLLVVTFLLVFVIPKFVGIFESRNMALPGITLAVLSLSRFVVNDWPYILCGVILIIVLFKLFKSSEQGRLKLDEIKLKMPLFKKAAVRLMTAKLSRTLSTLTATGITLTQAVRVSSKIVSNKLAEMRLLDAEEQIKQGHSLNEALASTKLFPNMLCHMTKIGEESGTLDQMLEKAAVYFEEDADLAITRLTTVLQPLLLVILAVIVLVIILSVLLPMIGLYQNVA